MKRKILFSTPSDQNIDQICNLLFANELNEKRMAYMPSDGADCPEKYRQYWQSLADKNDASFVCVDNSTDNKSESNKLLSSNILLITGGNTFRLLNNLRKSGLDKSIIDFTKKKEYVLAGFSAGAIILTPSIGVCTIKGFDENNDGIIDLSGLGIVPFEVFPHYSDARKEGLSDYRKKSSHNVKEISDDNYLVIEE